MRRPLKGEFEQHQNYITKSYTNRWDAKDAHQVTLLPGIASCAAAHNALII